MTCCSNNLYLSHGSTWLRSRSVILV